MFLSLSPLVRFPLPLLPSPLVCTAVRRLRRRRRGGGGGGGGRRWIEEGEVVRRRRDGTPGVQGQIGRVRITL